jgi:hypothetical protein
MQHNNHSRNYSDYYRRDNDYNRRDRYDNHRDRDRDSRRDNDYQSDGYNISKGKMRHYYELKNFYDEEMKRREEQRKKDEEIQRQKEREQMQEQLRKQQDDFNRRMMDEFKSFFGTLTPKATKPKPEPVDDEDQIAILQQQLRAAELKLKIATSKKRSRNRYSSEESDHEPEIEPLSTTKRKNLKASTPLTTRPIHIDYSSDDEPLRNETDSDRLEKEIRDLEETIGTKKGWQTRLRELAKKHDIPVTRGKITDQQRNELLRTIAEKTIY